MNRNSAVAMVLACASSALAGVPTYTGTFRQVYADVPYISPPPGETYTDVSFSNAAGIFDDSASTSFFNVGSAFARQSSQIGDAHISASASLDVERTGLSPVWGANQMTVEFTISEAQPMWISWLLEVPVRPPEQPQPTEAMGGVLFEGPGFMFHSDVDGTDFYWEGVAPAGVYRLAFSLFAGGEPMGVQDLERTLELYLSIPAPGSMVVMMGMGVVMVRRRAR